MNALGIELCDAGLQAAAVDGSGEPQSATNAGPLETMGLVYHDGRQFAFGAEAEANWYVHPRQVCHGAWGRLSRELSNLTVGGKAQSFSQLAYFQLRDFVAKLPQKPGCVVFAVPGSYLKDPATEDEKVGLLLGMAGELQLPLAGIVDMACSALCDPRLGYFDPALPLLKVDVQLHGAEITLLRRGDQMQRSEFAFLPGAGWAELLRHVTTSMGNRFLRHTAFDILEDGRIEQVFYRQCKQFLLGGATEQHFQINTANRNYEMTATREQLLADAAALVAQIVQGAHALLRKVDGRAESCTVALSDRAALLPGLAERFRAQGTGRILRMPAGAAAAGASCLASRWEAPADLGDVRVETQAPLELALRVRRSPWESRLLKARRTPASSRPTHAICEGVGHALGAAAEFSIGGSPARPDLELPEEFNAAGEGCLLRLQVHDGQVWLVESGDEGHAGLRTAVHAGDRLAVRCGATEVEVLFAHCAPGERPRR